MNIDHWLIEQVIVEPVIGRGASGDPSYGTPQTLDARVETAVRLVLDASTGNQIHAQFRVATKVLIPLGSRVWLPGDDTASTDSARRPLSIRNAYTQDGSFTLYETWFQ